MAITRKRKAQILKHLGIKRYNPYLARRHLSVAGVSTYFGEDVEDNIYLTKRSARKLFGAAISQREVERYNRDMWWELWDLVTPTGKPPKSLDEYKASYFWKDGSYYRPHMCSVLHYLLLDDEYAGEKNLRLTFTLWNEDEEDDYLSVGDEDYAPTVKTYTVPSCTRPFATTWKDITEQSRVLVSTDSDYELWFSSDKRDTLVITRESTLPAAAAQSYAAGPSHCLLGPMREYYMERADSQEDKMAKYKKPGGKGWKQLKCRHGEMMVKVDRLDLLIDQYAAGVPYAALEGIANDFKCAIDISSPLLRIMPESKGEGGLSAHIVVQPVTKALKRFKFINTSYNHVEPLRQIVDVTDCETVDELQFDELKTKLETDGTHHLWSEGTSGVTSIFTDGGRVQVRNEYASDRLEWESAQGLDCGATYLFDLDKMDMGDGYDLCALLYKFVAASAWVNNAVDFVDHIERPDELRSVDMKKAHANCHLQTGYEGFPEHLTDFRKCSDFHGVGIYRVVDLEFSKCSDAFNTLRKRFRLYVRDEIILPSVELKMLKKRGATFRITHGTWAMETHDVRFNGPEAVGIRGDAAEVMKKQQEAIGVDPLYDDGCKWNNMMRKYNGVRGYCRFTGTCEQARKPGNICFEGSQAMAAVIKAQLKDQPDKRVLHYEKSPARPAHIRVEYDRKHHKNRFHHKSFVYAYNRMGMIEQLMTMDLSQIVRVVVDGIYTYEKDVKCLNSFRPDEVDLKKFEMQKLSTTTRREFMSILGEFSGEDAAQIRGEAVEGTHRVTFHQGLGGAGKTHTAVVDRGLINPLGVFPSHKLAAAKAREYPGLSTTVHYRALTSDVERNEIIHKSNCLIIDEASMLTEAAAHVIVERYKHHRIIFCGDLLYQLPPVLADNAEGAEARQMTTEGMHVVEFNTNHRSVCKTLDSFTKFVRDLIDVSPVFDMGTFEARRGRRDRREAVIERFKTMGGKCIRSEDIKALYADDDMILGYKHNYDANTTMEDHYGIVAQDRQVKKWNLTEGGRDHCKGEIVTAEAAPEGIKSVERYSYTTHCIQGETCRGRIFINPRHMERSPDVLRLLYTALSRAKRFEQLYFVGGSNCSNVIDELSANGDDSAREAAERKSMEAEERLAKNLRRCAILNEVWGDNAWKQQEAAQAVNAWHAVAAGEEPGAAEVAPFSRSNITPDSVKKLFKK